MAVTLNRVVSTWTLAKRHLGFNPTSFVRRRFHVSVTAMGTSQEDFESAKQRLGTLKEDPGNVAKLKLYGLYKQATTGVCDIPKPGMFDMVGKAKWDSWNSLGQLSKDDAQKQYVAYVNELAKDEAPATTTSADTGGYETILFNREKKVNWLILNRPQKRNAISLKMYDEVNKCLKDAAEDDSVLTVMTGAGEFYSSGNDLDNFAPMLQKFNNDIVAASEFGSKISQKYVTSFIDFPKPLIGLINGPAVGMAVTVLGLFDIVYASDKATFHAPFSMLGISPEGCSTYTFPRIMGSAKANEFLMFNRKLTAREACDRGLVTEVFPDHLFRQETRKRIEEMGKLSGNSLLYAKQVNRELEKATLHKVNEIESINLAKGFSSEESTRAIAAFLTRKSNL